MGDVLPLRDIFVSLFLSRCMLFDTNVFSIRQEVALLVIAFVAGKAIIATACALIMRFPAQAAVIWYRSCAIWRVRFRPDAAGHRRKSRRRGDFIYHSQCGNY